MFRTLLLSATAATSALALSGCVIVTAPPTTGSAPQWKRPAERAPAVQPRATTASSCTGPTMSAKQIFAAAKDGVAVVETADGQGSAFVVEHRDGDTVLLTNAHVVDGSEQVLLRWHDGSSTSARVVARADGDQPATDLALLVAPGERGVPLRLAQDNPQVGQNVYVIGAPRGLDFSLSSGVVSQLRDGGEILQTDAAINGGNSGGPVLDENNCVVGVATFILRDSQGLNFAVSSRVIDRFLADPSIARVVPPSQGFDGPERGDNSDGGRRADSEKQIASTSCFFQSYKKTQGEDIGCSVTTRTNTNGHTIYDVAWSDGYRSSYVFWKDGVVEILSKGGSGAIETHMGNYEVYGNGVEISSNEGSITFLPEVKPTIN